MSAPRRLTSEREAAGIACDAHGHGLTYARFDRGDVARLDGLWRRVRGQLAASPRTLPRAAVLRALLLQGLAIAEARGIALSLKGCRVRLQYLLSPLELERLARFRLARWPQSTQPNTEQLQGALVRLALPVAETSERFARDALAAVVPRGKGTA